MAQTVQSISDRVRLELGDLPTTFDIEATGNGSAVRYETGQYPIDGSQLEIWVNNQPTNDAEVEERTGVITFDEAPADDAIIRIKGVKYRYFGGEDIKVFVEAAMAEQFHRRTDDFGRAIRLENMPMVEEYPLVILAVTKALWALLTDASFDIDIHAPDGVSIPRSQRHRQLMDMLSAQQQRYDEYAAALNIGINRIEVFNLRRLSKMTGRLVPVFVEREIDNNSRPERVWLPTNTYGGEVNESLKKTHNIKLVRGDTLDFELEFDFDVSDYTYLAQIKQYSDSQTRHFVLDVTQTGPHTLRFYMSPKVTSNMPLQSVWDVELTSVFDPEDVRTPYGGRVFAERDVSR